MGLSVKQRRTLSLSLAALCILALLSIVALFARQRFLSRGIAGQLPGPNPHAAVSPYGVNVEMLDWDAGAREAALSQIAAAGFRWVKQPVPWGREGQFDHLLRTAAELNLNVVPLLDGNPATDYAPPAQLQDFAAWAGQFATRYGDQITYYQIWDEPNLGSHWGWQPINPAGYTALLAAAHEAITTADPDAVIIAAALAPTVESGPANLSDVDYLAALYQLGAGPFFDVAAGKPYGFDTGPADRRVAREVFNFSRLILLREVMEQHGDNHSALWAGNFGWNTLPVGWSGRPSLWGQTDKATQAAYTQAAYQRAVDEWPWVGVLFLENYAPAAPPDDPRWGFALSTPDGTLHRQFARPEGVLIPNYQYPNPQSQSYSGGWRFGPGGADIGQSGDRVQVEFEGTDFGLRVRRGDYRAYFYVSVDGRPANALPTDERGAYLCLTSPDRSANDVVTIPVARHLSPGRHTAELVAERGWDQWALVGFSAANLPDRRPFRRAIAPLIAAAIWLAAAAIWMGRRADWGTRGRTLRATLNRLGQSGQAALTAAVATLFALTGWLTWLAPLRRLGEAPQTPLLAAVATLFYFSPWLLLNLASGLALFALILWRLDLGLALIALSAPFYVYPKPLAGYRFSLVEIVTLMTFAAWALRQIANRKSPTSNIQQPTSNIISPLDLPIAFFTLVAFLSLFFTERMDVATNELRVVVLEPALFYLLLRVGRLDRRGVWRVVDAFVLGGVAVAALGLVWYVAGSHVITAEGGLSRLRSIYGSPNNVGLYLGRVIPILLAAALTGRGRRRWLYGLALLPTLAAVALSFSKGAILLGLPVGIGLTLLCWRGRKAAIVLGVLVILALIALLLGSQIPTLSGRLSLSGATSDFRVSLWKASVEMIADHPWAGVGLDNFLYAYRGRYIRPEAWQEPGLSHPHNILLDYWTRLGLLGLAAGIWLQVAFWKTALGLIKRPTPHPSNFPIAGLIGSMGAVLAHGLVDQSYFLVDLAYAFMLTAGLMALLGARNEKSAPTAQNTG